MTDEAIDQANEILRWKGYKEAQLAVFTTRMASKALPKGLEIVSPFVDLPETILNAVRGCLPRGDELGSRTITPLEVRACLEG